MFSCIVHLPTYTLLCVRTESAARCAVAGYPGTNCAVKLVLKYWTCNIYLMLST